MKASRYLILVLTTILSFSTKALEIKVHNYPNETKSNIDLVINQLIKKSKKVHLKSIEKHSLEAVEPYGYFQATTKCEKTENLYQCYINPGKRNTLIKYHIAFSGEKNNPKLEEIVNYVNNIKPEYLDIEQYREYKNKVTQKIRDLGYIKANLNSSNLSVDTENNTSTVFFKATLGDIYHINQIKITNEYFNQSLIKKFLTIQEGSITNFNEIQKSKNNLNNSNLFDFADINTITDSKKAHRFSSFNH